jgi:Uma2 family endonuclease
MYARQRPNQHTITQAEYLAFADANEGRYEYSGGRIHAMTGGTLRHAVITVNISTQLNLQLAETPCLVASPDLRVHIASRDAYRYADIAIVCGPPQYLAGREDTITNPVALVEVASPSTVLLDHNDKLREYTQIDSLAAYLLVAQESPRVERYLRQDDGQWLYQAVTGLEAAVVLPLPEVASGITLALAQIYRKIAWDEADS